MWKGCVSFMFCTSCGTKIMEDSAKFCPKCGKQLVNSTSGGSVASNQTTRESQTKEKITSTVNSVRDTVSAHGVELYNTVAKHVANDAVTTSETCNASAMGSTGVASTKVPAVSIVGSVCAGIVALVTIISCFVQG